MRTGPPPLLPLLRSQVQGNLLALTYLHPDCEYSLTDAAARVGSSVKAVQQEASRLVDGGLLRSRRVGNVRLIRSVRESPVVQSLTDLLAVTYGPLPVLVDALAGVKDVERAFIFGSWAARYHGEPGPIPEDIDVLVVGTADLDDLEQRARGGRSSSDALSTCGGYGRPAGRASTTPIRFRRPCVPGPWSSCTWRRQE